MQFIHQLSKFQYRPCFRFSWRVQQSSMVIPINSAPKQYTNILRLSVFLSLVLVQVVLFHYSEQLNRSLHAYKDKQWHQLRCQSAKCSFLLPRLQWALSLWNVSNFVSRASLLPSFVFSSLVPPPLQAVSLPRSPTSKFTALISPQTCLASRCVRPAVVLGPVGWVQGSLWLTAVLSREWQTFPALSPRSMMLPLFPPQAAVTGWPITGLQV